MAPILTQLRVVTGRNFVIKRRGWKRSVLEGLLPVVLVAVTLITHQQLRSNRTQDGEQCPPRNISLSHFSTQLGPFIVSPRLPFSGAVMGRVTRLLNISSLQDVAFLDLTSSGMDEDYRDKMDVGQTGVEFLWRNDSRSVVVEGYVLRMPHELVKTISPGCSYRGDVDHCGRRAGGESSRCPDSQAVTSGLLGLQLAMEAALIQTFQNPEFAPPDLQVQTMPSPVVRPGVTITQLIISLGMVLSLISLAYFVTVTMATEQKTLTKVMLCRMGVTDGVFWTSWWLQYMITVLVVAVISTVLVVVLQVFNGSNVALFFLMALLYGSSLLSFSFVISTFTRAPKTAGLVAVTTSVLTGLLYLSVSLTRPSTVLSVPSNPMARSAVPLAGQLVLSIFPSAAVALGLDQIVNNEEEDAVNRFSAGEFPVLAIIMLVVDTVLYGLLAVYLDNVVPNKIRIHRKPWYFVTKSFWCRHKDDVRNNDDIPTDTPGGPHIEKIAEHNADLRAVRMRDLHNADVNEQKRGKHCLNGLDLDVYEGQVTCILGHAGAGKSTVMNILAGLARPSCGAAFVYDLNASSCKDNEDLTRTVAYLPQRNVLQEDLTVEEHMHVAAVLRGSSSSGSVEHTITRCLSEVHLDSERRTMVRNLSECQKRRLSLAVSLLQNAKVLLLDEPTRGMAPEERHHVWTLLHDKKKTRVILFTSCCMDEADYFSDRKVVLSGGRLRCVGSSEFLKEHFGVGYYLHLTVRPSASVERVTRAVCSHARGATLVRREDNVLTIAIPPLQTGKLTAMFRHLESKARARDYLGITKSWLTLTTLEDVFTKLGREEEAGNVFISPLLTPSDSALLDLHHGKGGHGHRDSMSPTTPRSHFHKSAAQLQDSPRRLSALLSRQPYRDVKHIGSDRRTSALPVLQQTSGAANAHRAVARRLSHIFARPPDHHKPRRGSVDSHQYPGQHSRRFSPLFAKSSHQHKPRRGSTDYHSSPGRRSSSNSASRFGFGRRRKRRSSSFAIGSLATDPSRPLESVGSTDDLEETPPFSGTVLPTSQSGRRATVAALNDLRSMFKRATLSSEAGDRCESVLQDTLTTLNMLDTYQQARKASVTDSVDENPMARSHQVEDPEKVECTRPAKIGEVLANLTPPRQGARLGMQRLAAMLKMRVLVRLNDRWGLLLRLGVTVTLALLAIGASYAAQSLTKAAQSPGQRVPLFGADYLVYTNLSGGNADRLLADLSSPLNGTDRMTEFSSERWDPSVGVESVLGILKSDGSAYRLYHSAACPLALSRLLSFLAATMRHSAGLTPFVGHNDSNSNEPHANDSYSSDTYISYNQNGNSSANVSLASNVSAWLKPWPAVEGTGGGCWDWVSVLLLGLALTLTPAANAVRMVRERKGHIRQYLSVAGISRLTYFGSAVIVDCTEYIIAAGCLVIICAASQMPVFEEEYAIHSLVVMIVLYAMTGVLWAYAASFVFCRPRICCLLLTLVLAAVNVGCFCLVHFLNAGHTRHVSSILHVVFTVLWPPYIPFGTLLYIANKRAGAVEDSPANYLFQESGNVKICFVMLAVDVVLLSCLVVLLDKLTSDFPTPSCCKDRRRSYGNPLHSTDDSVQAEIQRVQNLHGHITATQWPCLVVDGLSNVRTHHKPEARAVDCATFTVQKGEVLGLLGPKGAGKSTLMNMILGVCPSSKGSVYIDSHKASLSKRGEVKEKIGYCPQYSPLWGDMTVDQHVHFMAAVKGLHHRDFLIFTDSLYHDLDLDDSRSQKVSQLSDCEKRKLCFAMSMLGSPAVMLVDEPSGGMDQRSRRLYWDALEYFIRSSQRSTIISLHCVEEAQAVCSRIAVIVKGQIRCLGTLEELRQRCSKTYRLEVSLRAWDGQDGHQRMDMLVMFVRELFPRSRLVERFRHRAVFAVDPADQDFSLANTFGTLESLKRNLDLENFTFSQSTLEQMFTDLAREHNGGDSRCTAITIPPISSDTVCGSAEIQEPDRQLPDDQADEGSLHLHHPNSHVTHNEDEGGGGASCEDPISDADAAVGVFIQQHDNEKGVAELDGGGATDAGAAAACDISDKGVHNAAFITDGGDDMRGVSLS